VHGAAIATSRSTLDGSTRQPLAAPDRCHLRGEKAELVREGASDCSGTPCVAIHSEAERAQESRTAGPLSRGRAVTHDISHSAPTADSEPDQPESGRSFQPIRVEDESGRAVKTACPVVLLPISYGVVSMLPSSTCSVTIRMS